MSKNLPEICKYPDVYVVHRRNPNLPDDMPELQPGIDTSFRLQKYHYHAELSKYRPVFRRMVALNLHIDDYRLGSGHNYQLPMIIDAHPRYPLPSRLAMPDLHDPLINSLIPEFRMLLRYNPEEDFGCLVHIGMNFVGVDDTPVDLLWISADRIERAERRAELSAPHTT